MKVTLDSKKIKKKIIIHSTLMILFLGAAILVLVMNSGNEDKSVFQIIAMSGGLMLIAVLAGFPLLHISKLKKNANDIIFLSNDKLVIKTLLFKPVVEVFVKDIKSCSVVDKTRKLKQVTLVLKEKRNGTIPLVNQIKGGSVYFNDYFLERSEFEKFAKQLSLKVKKKR